MQTDGHMYVKWHSSNTIGNCSMWPVVEEMFDTDKRKLSIVQKCSVCSL